MVEKNFGLQILEAVNNEDWAAVEVSLNNSEFAQLLGMSISLDNPSLPRCEIREVSSYHLGGVGQGYINGAVISAMFDYLLGLTALPYVNEGYFATSNINVRFVKPVINDRFYAVATEKKRIGMSVFSEATLYNGLDEACVHATGEIRVGISGS